MSLKWDRIPWIKRRKRWSASCKKTDYERSDTKRGVFKRDLSRK